MTFSFLKVLHVQEVQIMQYISTIVSNTNIEQVKVRGSS